MNEIERAEQIVAEWEQSNPGTQVCEFFRSGGFDIQHGEHRCAACRVPMTVHRAYRLLVRAAVPNHG